MQHSSRSSWVHGLGKTETANLLPSGFSKNHVTSTLTNSNASVRNSYSGAATARVVLKRKDFTVDDEHPHGTYQQIDVELQDPSAAGGALSPLQL